MSNLNKKQMSNKFQEEFILINDVITDVITEEEDVQDEQDSWINAAYDDFCVISNNH